MSDSQICLYCGTPFNEDFGCDMCNKPVRPEKPGPMGEFRPEDPPGELQVDEVVKFVGPVKNPDGSVFMGGAGKPIPPHEDCDCPACQPKKS